MFTAENIFYTVSITSIIAFYVMYGLTGFIIAMWNNTHLVNSSRKQTYRLILAGPFFLFLSYVSVMMGVYTVFIVIGVFALLLLTMWLSRKLSNKTYVKNHIYNCYFTKEFANETIDQVKKTYKNDRFVGSKSGALISVTVVSNNEQEVMKKIQSIDQVDGLFRDSTDPKLRMYRILIPTLFFLATFLHYSTLVFILLNLS